MASKFLDGSPVSDTSNPFSGGVGSQAGADSDVLGSLDIDGRESLAGSDLDQYGSDPVVADAAAGRPLNPPSLAGSDR